MEQHQLLQAMAEVVGRAAEREKWEQELTPNIGWAYQQINQIFRELDSLVKRNQRRAFDRAALEELQTFLGTWRTAMVLFANMQVVLKLDPYKSFDFYGEYAFKSPEEFETFMQDYKDDGLYEELLKDNFHSLEIRFHKQ